MHSTPEVHEGQTEMDSATEGVMWADATRQSSLFYRLSRLHAG